MRSLLTVAVLTAVIGCSGPQISSQPKKDAPPAKTSNEAPKKPERVSDRPGNTKGVVFIAMYHRVLPEEGSFVRSVENFKKDLQRMYDMGFRPVTVGEYIDDKMNLPPGASPVAMTWDDSTDNQFRYLADGSIDPTCAIGIWQEFAKKHPDFPVKGSFFINANGPFGKDGKKKVAQLLAWGCEVDSHTMTHANLAKLTDEGVEKELAGMQDYLRGLGVKNPRILCLPFGVRPKNRSLLKSFEYKGRTYTHQAALMVGAGPAPAPGDPNRDLYALPRIQAYDGDYGLTYWLDKVEGGKVAPYVEP